MRCDNDPENYHIVMFWLNHIICSCSSIIRENLNQNKNDGKSFDNQGI